MAPDRSSSFPADAAPPTSAWHRLRSSVAVAVALAGAAGASVRWAVGTLVSGDGFPVATFSVNVVGCLLLGAIRHAPERWRVPAAVGFCGGLTTMSTFSLETAQFLDHGRPGLAVTYLGASVVAGLAAYTVGARGAPGERALPC